MRHMRRKVFRITSFWIVAVLTLSVGALHVALADVGSGRVAGPPEPRRTSR